MAAGQRHQRDVDLRGDQDRRVAILDHATARPIRTRCVGALLLSSLVHRRLPNRCVTASQLSESGWVPSCSPWRRYGPDQYGSERLPHRAICRQAGLRHPEVRAAGGVGLATSAAVSGDSDPLPLRAAWTSKSRQALLTWWPVRPTPSSTHGGVRSDVPDRRRHGLARHTLPPVGPMTTRVVGRPRRRGHPRRPPHRPPRRARTRRQPTVRCPRWTTPRRPRLIASSPSSSRRPA